MDLQISTSGDSTDDGGWENPCAVNEKDALASVEAYLPNSKFLIDGTLFKEPKVETSPQIETGL